MRLRDHPGMAYYGIPSWPPVWTKKGDDGGVGTLRGEVGKLEYVFANERISNKLFLVMRHEGERYVGCLIFNERSLCEQMARLLRVQTGKLISEIGDMDVGHML
jgi:hypothetical protein